MEAVKAGLSGKANYAIAKNLKLIKPIIEDFNADNQNRVQSFAKKDGEGQMIIVGGRYDFGDQYNEAEKIYNELLEKEVSFIPYTVERDDETDRIPATALVELIDLIITEPK